MTTKHEGDSLAQSRRVLVLILVTVIKYLDKNRRRFALVLNSRFHSAITCRPGGDFSHFTTRSQNREKWMHMCSLAGVWLDFSTLIQSGVQA